MRHDMVRKAYKWLKHPQRTRKMWRTFCQATMAYISLHIFVLLEWKGDWPIAIKAVLIGAIAAGLSAVWGKDKENE